MSTSENETKLQTYLIMFQPTIFPGVPRSTKLPAIACPGADTEAWAVATPRIPRASPLHTLVQTISILVHRFFRKARLKDRLLFLIDDALGYFQLSLIIYFFLDDTEHEAHGSTSN